MQRSFQLDERIVTLSYFDFNAIATMILLTSPAALWARDFISLCIGCDGEKKLSPRITSHKHHSGMTREKT
jgi:hypothetical protein